MMHLSRLLGRDKGCGRKGNVASPRSSDPRARGLALQLKGLQWSLGIHGMIFLAAALVPTIVVPHDRMMVIDFTLAGFTESPAMAETSPGRVPMRALIPRTKDIAQERFARNDAKKGNSFPTVPAMETEPVGYPAQAVDGPAALPTEEQGNTTSSLRMSDEQEASSIAEALADAPPIEAASGIDGDTGVSGAAAHSEASKAMNLSEAASGIGGSADVTNAAAHSETSKAVYLKEQYLYIRERIVTRISYPSLARKMGWCGRVKIAFVVREDGGVDNVRVVESSGFTLLDTNTIDTVKKAAPFPGPPIRAEIRMAITYRLN